MIQWMSEHGILVGTVDSAGMPALMAATSPEARDGGFYGPQRPGGVGGPPGETSLWKPMRSDEDGARLWAASEELTGVTFGS